MNICKQCHDDCIRPDVRYPHTHTLNDVSPGTITCANCGLQAKEYYECDCHNWFYEHIKKYEKTWFRETQTTFIADKCSSYYSPYANTVRFLIHKALWELFYN